MAFVFPVILSFFVLLLYLGFYVHDRFVLEEIAEEAVLYGSVCGTEIVNAEILSEEKCNSLLDKSFLCLQNPRMEVTRVGNRINVLLKGDFQIPVFHGVIRVFSKEYTQVEADAEAVIITPLTIIRLDNYMEGE